MTSTMASSTHCQVFLPLLIFLLLGHHAHGSLWSDDEIDDLAFDRVDRQPIHVLRHHHHQQQQRIDDDEHATQGPFLRAVRSGMTLPQSSSQSQPRTSQQQPKSHPVNIRHHNHRNRHAPNTTPRTTSTTPTLSPIHQPIEEHRLRHSNKMYKPYALIESRELDSGAQSSARHGSGRQPPPPSQPTVRPAGKRDPHAAQQSRSRPQRPPAAATTSFGGSGMRNITTTSIQRRYFDRDPLITSVRRGSALWLSRTTTRAPPTTPSSTSTTTTSTTTTTTATAAPPPVRMRHSGSGAARSASNVRRKASTNFGAGVGNDGIAKPFLNTFDRYDVPYLRHNGAASAWGRLADGYDDANDDSDDSDADDVIDDEDADADDEDDNDDDDDDIDDELDPDRRVGVHKNSNRDDFDDVGDDEYYDDDAADATDSAPRKASHSKNAKRLTSNIGGVSLGTTTTINNNGNGKRHIKSLASTRTADRHQMLDDERDGAKASGSHSYVDGVGGMGGGRIKQHDHYTDEDDTEAKTYIPGTLTEHKLQTLGTQDAVQESQQRQFQLDSAGVAGVHRHISQIREAAACAWPRPKVVRVQTDPTSNKHYAPHCTVLHRCGDDTGCCLSDSHSCVAETNQTVELLFYVTTHGSRQSVIEKLTFVNHTKCHCVSRTDRRDGIDLTAPLSPPQELRSATVISCTCPTLFERVLQPDGTCRCDCVSSNRDCVSKKQGHEHFSVHDRICIDQGRCKPPKCEYGSYDKTNGSCPRKDHKFRMAARY